MNPTKDEVLAAQAQIIAEQKEEIERAHTETRKLAEVHMYCDGLIGQARDALREALWQLATRDTLDGLCWCRSDDDGTWPAAHGSGCLHARAALAAAHAAKPRPT